MTTNHDLHELTAGYALDALDEDDRAAYEAHLADCEQCRTELADLSETVGALGLATEGPAPPAALRDRILVAAREEGSSNVVAIGATRRRRAYMVGALAAVAVAALVVGLYAALSGGSPARLAVSVDGGVAQATVRFDAAPAGKTYELWVIEGKAAPRPAGVFGGGGKQVVALTRPAPDGSVVAVTLERAGGATTPTPPILEQTTVSA